MRDGGLTSQEFVKEQEGREYRETGEEGRHTPSCAPAAPSSEIPK